MDNKIAFGVVLNLNGKDIVIDYLNENKQDNNINNLVISCNNCNRARGAILSFIERMKKESLSKFIECVKRYWETKNT